MTLHDNLLTGDDTTFIRAAVMHRFEEVVTELGGDPAPLLARARIPAGVAAAPEDVVSFAAWARLLEDAAATVGRPDLGRLLARRQGLEVLGALGAVTTTAPTLGDGLGLVRSYVTVFSAALDSDLDRGPVVSRFWFRANLRRIAPHPQALELLLGRTIATLIGAVGRGFWPAAVLVPHAPLTAEADYHRDFGSSVRFEQESAGLLLRTEDLGRSLSAEAEVHRVVQGYLAGLVDGPGGDVTLATAVRRMIEHRLPAGPPSLEGLASTLALHPRTLQRQLADEGTSPATLLDEVRRDLVVQYLRDPNLDLSKVATLLGYSHQSVLTRACRRWYGVTPSQLRTELLDGRELPDVGGGDRG